MGCPPKAVRKGKFIAIQFYLKKQTNKKSLNNPSLQLEKEEQKKKKKPKVSRRKEIIKIKS